MKTYIDNNFYFNKFIYFFLLQNLNNFFSFKIPVVKRQLIQMKRTVAASSLLFLSRLLFMIDHMAAQIGWWERWPTSWRGMMVFPLQYIDSVSVSVFVKPAN